MSNSRNSGSYPLVACYFCNESLDERLWREHINHCGAVLEECTNKCGAYLPRRNLKSHENHCLKFQQFERNSLPRNYRMETVKQSELNYNEKIISLLNLLRTTVKEAELERKKMMNDAMIIKKRLEEIENTTKIVQFNVSDESKKLENNFTTFDERLNTLDSDLNQIEGRTRASFYAVSYRLDMIEGNVIDQRNKQEKILLDCENEIKDLKKFVANESILIGDIWDEQKKRMNDLKLELEMRCNVTKEIKIEQNNLSEKFEELVKELKTHSECILKQEKNVKTLKYQLNDTIKYLEEFLIKNIDQNLSICKCHCNNLIHGSTNGRLIWRIENYKEKMTLAKESDAIICSPIFLNKDYGYALQMKLYLNGRGRWKDRNIIGCLRVVEGPWDPLLEWPCILRATVTLRDQDNPANNIKKIVKTKANVKDEDSNGSENNSVIDMFIPHTALTRYDGYTKNNVLFVDIQITEMKGSLSMSSLIA